MDYPIKTLTQLKPILVGFRKQAGLTQAALASRLGITQQSYAKIEANPASTSVERLFTILRLLGGEIVLATDATTAVDASAAKPAAGTPDADRQDKPSRPGPTSPKRRAAPPKLVPPARSKKERW